MTQASEAASQADTPAAARSDSMRYELTQRAHQWERAGREPTLLAEGEDLARIADLAGHASATSIEVEFVAESLSAGGGGAGIILNRAIACGVDTMFGFVSAMLGGLLGGKLLGIPFIGLTLGLALFFGIGEGVLGRSLGMFIAGLEYQRQVSALPMVKRVLRALLAGIPFATLLVGQRVMAERSAASRGPLATRIITGFYGLSIAYVAVSATIWILMAGHTVTHEHCGSGLRCAAAGLLMADYERLGSPQGALDIVTYYLVGTVLANYLLFVLYAWAVCRLAHRQQWSWFRTVQLAALLLGISAGHGSVAFGALCCLAISLPRFVRHGHAEHVRIFADYQRRKRVSAGS